MDVAGPAMAVTGVALGVCALIVVGVPVAFLAACIVAKRSETDPADPWRLAYRLTEPPAPVDDWRVALEQRLRALPAAMDLDAAVAQRVAEMDALGRLMYGGRDLLPVVRGRTAGAHRA